MTKQPTQVQPRRNRLLLWGGLAVIVVIAVVVALMTGGGSDASATKWEIAPVQVDGTPLPRYDATQRPDPALGDTIPTLTGRSIDDGTPVTIGPGRGAPQMIVFVAHWCPHCQAEVPRLVALADDGVFDGVEVSAVATGTSADADNYPPSAWLQGEQWPFPVLADDADTDAARAYGLSAYPFFVLVHADGTVAGRGSGELPEAQIRANIKALKAGDDLPIASSGKRTNAG